MCEGGRKRAPVAQFADRAELVTHWVEWWNVP